ncbi:hypothetical protein PAMP_007414 [Pampus punctatissimus]
MRSYSHLLYIVEDSVVNNKAIQTYSAWWPECQHVTEPWRPGTGTGGLLVWTEEPHSHVSNQTIIYFKLDPVSGMKLKEYSNLITFMWSIKISGLGDVTSSKFGQKNTATK